MLAGIKRGKRRRNNKEQSTTKTPSPPLLSDAAPSTTSTTSTTLNSSTTVEAHQRKSTENSTSTTTTKSSSLSLPSPPPPSSSSRHKKYANDTDTKRQRRNHHQRSSNTSTSMKPTPKTATIASAAANREAAEELRKMLSSSTDVDATGDGPITTMSGSSSSSSTSKLSSGRVGAGGGGRGDSGVGVVEDILTGLERRGKISSTSISSVADAVVVMGGKSFSGSKAPVLQREDFRKGSRKGKLKPTKPTNNNTNQPSSSYLHANTNTTIAEMIHHERTSTTTMDETYARSIARLGSRYKGSDTNQRNIAGHSAGADEVDTAGDGGVDMTLYADREEGGRGRLTEAARYEREKSRQMARVGREMAITDQCWWWMESGAFRKHRLISLGDHISLVLSPSHLSLVKWQCMLVPVKHNESYAVSEDEIWDERIRFQTALRSMFRKDGMGVLFCETVLPSKGLWQARMEVIPVPLSVEQDAAIYFKSALTEQAEEWGTHNKLLPTSKTKGLRQTIPTKRGFHYFHVEWGVGDDGGDNAGFVQMIETESFPKNFALDTIAGMMDLDPVRMKRRQKASDEDRSVILNFVAKWKEFDWTLTLDE